MRFIFKQTMSYYEPSRAFSLPAGSRFISAINQREQIYLYYEQGNGPDIPLFYVHVRPTSGEVLEGTRFLNTLSFDNGEFIAHIYVEEPQVVRHSVT